MRDLERRIANLEQEAAARRAKDDPRRWLLVATQMSMKHATIPAGPDDSPERIAQLAQVDRLTAACESGDVDSVLDDLVKLGFAGPEPWKPIHVPQTT